MDILKNFPNSGNKDTRSGFGAGVAEAGRRDSEVVAFCADLTGSLKLDEFQKENPDRFFECGIQEANMVDAAAGISLCGKIPFIGSFANFVTSRVYDQIRQCVAYAGTNVKIGASHAGITLGEDGATHQVMEDIGMMRMLPNMTVLNPCDYNQTKAATIAAARYNGPVYIRFGRPSVPNFTPADAEFEIGKAIRMVEGSDVTIFATGHLVWEAINAAQALSDEGISAEVIDIATIKPLDTEAVLASISKTGAAVTAEEHLIAGGMGELISGVIARSGSLYPIEFVAVDDKFGQSGTPARLMKEYGLDCEHIVAAAKKALSRK